MYFSNVDFLRNIRKESRKKSQLKQILILISRISALAALVFAFSQPYIPSDNNKSVKPNPVVGIYVDNSFSMNAMTEQGQLIEAVRNKAAEIAMAYNQGTQFRLITNDMEPRHRHLFNREQMVQLITEITVSPNSVPLSGIIERFSDDPSGLPYSQSGQIYLLSDFQRKTTDPGNFKTDSMNSFFFLPFTPRMVNNLFIDSCWAEIPAHQLNQEEELKVKIVNRSDEDYQNLPLKLFINDSLKTLSSFNISAQGEMIASLKYKNFNSGLQLGNIEITDYPFTHDNNFYLSYNVQPTLSVLALHDDNQASSEGMRYIRALFRDDNYVILADENIKNLKISQLNRYNAIFLVNLPEPGTGLISELERAVKEGTTLIVFPELKKNFEAYNNLLSRIGSNLITGIDSGRYVLSGINFDNRVYREVFREKKENAIMPEIGTTYRFSESTGIPETNLLWFRNGRKALSELMYGKGKIYVFSFPLDDANKSFAEDLLFVPTIYSITLNSLPTQEIAYTIGRNRVATLQQSPGQPLIKDAEVRNPKTGQEFIPDLTTTEGNRLRIEFGDHIREAGHYLLQSDGKTPCSFSFNYNRSESDLRYFNTVELGRAIENSALKYGSVIGNTGSRFTDILEEIQHGVRLWKWFILAALLFLLAEGLISRFMK